MFNDPHFGTPLILVRRRNEDDERVAIRGSLQKKSLIVRIDLDIEVGDVVEESLPNGKTRTLRITDVHYARSPFPNGKDDLDHITATWEDDTRRALPASRGATIENAHARISASSATLYREGFYSEAVRAAFQAIEARVQALTGRQESGQSLMSAAFASKNPILDVSTTQGRNAQAEHEGFKFLFMGAISGLRNPRSHGEIIAEDAACALEYLIFASMLMRRLDLAEDRL